jgi:hypothetical protein
LVKWSIATRMNLCPLLAFGLTGPITSIPHIANGQGDIRLNSSAGGVLTLSL